MLNSTHSIQKIFMCILFETRSKSSLCPCQLKNLKTKLLTYRIQNFRLCRSNRLHPMKYVSICWGSLQKLKKIYAYPRSIYGVTSNERERSASTYPCRSRVEAFKR